MNGDAPFIHPTAMVEAGVSLGPGTKIWDHAHLRGPSTQLGRDCIVGGKSYIAYDVSIGDRCKINAFVYVCAGVTLEQGVFLGAGTTFTNDAAPRATTPDLTELLSSDAPDDMPRTLVRAGASLGARSVIGPGVVIGRFAMVGMGAVVTRDVPDQALVIGQPARLVGAVCRCGRRIFRAEDGRLREGDAATCTCGEAWFVRDGAPQAQS